MYIHTYYIANSIHDMYTCIRTYIHECTYIHTYTCMYVTCHVCTLPHVVHTFFFFFLLLWYLLSTFCLLPGTCIHLSLPICPCPLSQFVFQSDTNQFFANYRATMFTFVMFNITKPFDHIFKQFFGSFVEMGLNFLLFTQPYIKTRDRQL